MVILATFSTPHVWDALSLDPVLGNPCLILMLFSLIILVNLGTGLAPLQLAGETIAGSILGGGLGLACIYLSLAANGGSSANSVSKVGSVEICCLTWSPFHVCWPLLQAACRHCPAAMHPCNSQILFSLQAAMNLAVSASAIFWLTLLRFKYRQWNLFYVMASITLAIDASASYHATKNHYK